MSSTRLFHGATKNLGRGQWDLVRGTPSTSPADCQS